MKPLDLFARATDRGMAGRLGRVSQLGPARL